MKYLYQGWRMLNIGIVVPVQVALEDIVVL